MRLGIMMPVNSPWSCEVALRLRELGNAVHVIDFSDRPMEKAGYLFGFENLKNERVRTLKESGIQIHFLKTK
jgi:hypothetical protein